MGREHSIIRCAARGLHQSGPARDLPLRSPALSLVVSHLRIEMRFYLSLSVALLLWLPGGGLVAQDTTRRGVTIGLTYDPASRPGIAILPITGSAGDSIRAVMQRDFDYSDRFTIVPLEASDPSTFRGTRPGAELNYPLFARLGAAALIQATVGTNSLHVALHDVAKGTVINVQDFP